MSGAINELIKGKSPQEILELAVDYEHGNTSICKNQKIANELYLIAYKKGNLTASIFLGQIFELGKGVAVDYEKALYYYEQGANNQIIECYSRLGILYLKGLGVRQDYLKALKWFYQGRDAGDIYTACLWLGYMYENGLGVKQSDLMAIKCYQASAFNGNPYAQFQVGLMYEVGIGTKIDLKQAKYYYLLSSKSPETKEKSKQRLKEIEGEI